MISEFVKIANKLDSLGLTKEADVLDGLISKVAGDVAGDFDFDFGQEEEVAGDATLSEYDQIRLSMTKEEEKTTNTLFKKIINNPKFSKFKRELSQSESEELKLKGILPVVREEGNIEARKNLKAIISKIVSSQEDSYPEVPETIYDLNPDNFYCFVLSDIGRGRRAYVLNKSFSSEDEAYDYLDNLNDPSIGECFSGSDAKRIIRNGELVGPTKSRVVLSESRLEISKIQDDTFSGAGASSKQSGAE